MVLFCLLSGCTKHRSWNCDIIVETIKSVMPDSTELALYTWNSDHYGYNHKRTYEMAKRIIRDYDLIGKPMDTVIKYLGSNFNGSVGYAVKSFCTDSCEIINGTRNITYYILEDGKLQPLEFAFRIQE